MNSDRMNKKIIISIIILLLLTGAVVLWSVQKEEEVQQEQQVEEQQMFAKEENVFSQEELEKIEKLKNDNSLVWYEIPEMGIRFKITPDTKEDLGYSYKEYMSFKNSISVKQALLYSSSETDEKLSSCSLNEESGWNCGLIYLNIVSKNDIDNYSSKNQDFAYCSPGTLFVSNDNYICITKNKNIGEYKINISDKEYLEFFNISDRQNNNFGIYLDTFEKF